MSTDSTHIHPLTEDPVELDSTEAGYLAAAANAAGGSGNTATTVGNTVNATSQANVKLAKLWAAYVHAHGV